VSSNYALERSVRGWRVGAAGARNIIALPALDSVSRGPLKADVRWPGSTNSA
jgi:hypothetical protein